jgi:hypothetical protein
MSWICPKCERELRKPNQVHYCIKVSVDELLKDQSEELVLAFDQLLAEVAEWDGVTVSCSKNCIVFVHKQTFFVIRPMKKWLDIKFYSEKKPEESYVFKSTFYAKRYENHIRLASLNDLKPRIFAMVKESYRIL